MQFRPIKYKVHRAPWQFPLDDFQGFYVDDRFLIAILAMEVRRCMVIPKHLDDDPEELTDGWYALPP